MLFESAILFLRINDKDILTQMENVMYIKVLIEHLCKPPKCPNIGDSLNSDNADIEWAIIAIRKN